ncbi:sperm flagellar protein 1-like [Drosophila miranda]|uniref:sperm flagellar protein 1-like n=1 Tax=Drosophila miranda TaxID=7229 RepID=UPI0007E70719|nr:sperm flagellar protein 1-like [Drosophila miranda]
MSSFRQLNYQQCQMLDQWLLTYGVMLNHRTRHEFSDVLPVARLFNKVHPGRVDLNRYVSRNSVAMKASNWRIFNARVLKKMNMGLTSKDEDKLASAVEWVQDALLYRLMMTVEEIADVGQEFWYENNTPKTKKKNQETLM